MSPAEVHGAVAAYIELGLSVGRHVDGLVDAYYGPPDVAARISAEPARPPEQLVTEARALLAAIDGGSPLDDPGRDDAGAGRHGDPSRRRWLRAQVVGLLTTARRLSGEHISYADEVESCYGVRPHPIEWDQVAEAHKRLEAAVPGSGPLDERLNVWREAHQIPTDRLVEAIGALAERSEGAHGAPVRIARRRDLRVRAGDGQAMVRVQHVPG